MGTPFPSLDPTSPSGYELGMRKLILPQVGVDGCHWIMHTQKLLADGGFRIRFTDLDNSADGREIHWSHGFIWWLITLGHIHSTISGMPLPASVELVAPYANTLLLVFLIASLPWVVFRRFGPIASAGLAVSLSSIYVFFEFFMVGNVDHHGIAAATALTCALLLAVGGAGWVAVERPVPLKPKEAAARKTFEYLIDSKAARRFFIGSGIAGAAALWVSAATAVPTFFGIGIGAMISVLLFGRHDATDETQYEPVLWRWWGITGCCGSLLFYLLEYFPLHMGMRLEVNHPLYSLAWIGGGEILYRLANWRVSGIRPWQGRSAIPIFLGAISAVLVLPILVLLFPERFFWIADNFLWQFHKDYIHEFKDIIRWTEGRSVIAIINVALFPLTGIVVFRLLFHNFFRTMLRNVFHFQILSELGRSWLGILTLIVLPAMLLTVLGTIQVRWLGIANALWLPAIPTALGCIFGTGRQHRFLHLVRQVAPGEKFRQAHDEGNLVMVQTFQVVEWIMGGVIVAILFFTFPITSFRETWRGLWGQTELGPEEAFGIYIRDLSHSLRRANGNKNMVIISGPTTTTYMMYYGGMKGVGTLYWENVPGLKAAAEIYAAPTDDKALELIKKHEVSHIAIFASDAFADQYTRLNRGLKFGATTTDAFIPGMIANSSCPQWLKPIHFASPSQLDKEWLMLREVNVDQTPAQAHIGISEYYDARGDATGAMKELEAAIAIEPTNNEAWFRIGSLLALHNGIANATEAFDKGLAGRSPAEVSKQCGDLAMRFFNISRHAESAYLLRRALAALPEESGSINALAWLLATSFDENVRNPAEALTLAAGNIANPLRATFLDTLAAAQAANGQMDEAAATMKEAIKILPSMPPNSSSLDLQALEEHLRHYESGLQVRSGGAGK